LIGCDGAELRLELVRNALAPVDYGAKDVEHESLDALQRVLSLRRHISSVLRGCLALCYGVLWFGGTLQAICLYGAEHEMFVTAG